MESSYRLKWAIGAAAISCAAVVLGVLLVRGPLVREARAEQESEERYLFVWAGDQARTNPDFLAVIDFDEDSNRYGSVISTAPLLGPGAAGNEPHHVSLSAGLLLRCVPSQGPQVPVFGQPAALVYYR